MTEFFACLFLDRKEISLVPPPHQPFPFSWILGFFTPYFLPSLRGFVGAVKSLNWGEENFIAVHYTKENKKAFFFPL